MSTSQPPASPSRGGDEADPGPRSAAHSDGLLVERVGPPDDLRKSAGLDTYLDSLSGKVFRPSAGDAVAFSCRVLSEGGDLLHETEAEAPRVLLLGDPLVPLGLSAALQRLALGEEARVTIPMSMLELASDGSGRSREMKLLTARCRAAGRADDDCEAPTDQDGRSGGGRVNGSGSGGSGVDGDASRGGSAPAGAVAAGRSTPHQQEGGPSSPRPPASTDADVAPQPQSPVGAQGVGAPDSMASTLGSRQSLPSAADEWASPLHNGRRLPPPTPGAASPARGGGKPAAQPLTAGAAALSGPGGAQRGGRDGGGSPVGAAVRRLSPSSCCGPHQGSPLLPEAPPAARLSGDSSSSSSSSGSDPSGIIASATGQPRPAAVGQAGRSGGADARLRADGNGGGGGAAAQAQGSPQHGGDDRRRAGHKNAKGGDHSTASAAAKSAAATMKGRGHKGQSSGAEPQLELMPELPAVAAAASAAANADARLRDQAGAGEANEAGGEAGAAAAAAAARRGGGEGDGEGAPLKGRAVVYEIHVLAIIPGRGKLSGRPILSEAAEQLPNLDLGAALRVDKRLRPKRHRRGVVGWAEKHASFNYKVPFRSFKGLLRCLGVRG